MRAVSVTVEPESQLKPNCANAEPMRADSPASTMSQPARSAAPPPMAKPWIAATIGTGNCQARCNPMCRSAVHSRTSGASSLRTG